MIPWFKPNISLGYACCYLGNYVILTEIMNDSDVSNAFFLISVSLQITSILDHTTDIQCQQAVPLQEVMSPSEAEDFHAGQQSPFSITELQ